MIPLLDTISKEIRVPLWMNMSSRAKRQIELNHEKAIKSKQNQKYPKTQPKKKTCDWKIYSFIIVEHFSSSRLKMIEWNLKQCNMGMKNDHEFIKDSL